MDASTIEGINRDCKLKEGTLILVGDEVRFQPPPDEEFERLECALSRLKERPGVKFGFIGNERDSNAVLKPPLRYIAEGSSLQIAALANAAQADKWTVVMRASSPDGLAIVQFESGPAMTGGQATALLDRIWKKEFGDIAFGMAPRKLSDPGDIDE